MGNVRAWEPLDTAAMDEQDSEIKKGAPSEFFKPKVGKNRVRFLPKLRGWKAPTTIVHEHFAEDVPGREQAVRFCCPRRMASPPGKCVECEKADALRRTGNPVDAERARSHLPRMRVYCNVIDRSDESFGPKVFAFGKGIWDDLKRIADDKADGGDFTDPSADGFDIIIDRVGKGKEDTRYSVRRTAKCLPLSDDQEEVDEWIERQWSLADYCKVLPEKELRALLRGERTEREEREECEKRPALPAGKRRRTAQDDVEDEDPFE